MYSCKYSKMLDIIESNKDMLTFVFYEDVKATRLIMMSCILELFGYQLYVKVLMRSIRVCDTRYIHEILLLALIQRRD